MAKDKRYIPALGVDWLTPVYDPFLRWLMPEAQIKQRLILQAGIEPGHRVLDLGCGTATLTLLIKQTHPEAVVVGMDGDPQVLEIGRAKARQAGVDFTLEQGMAYRLPYPDGSFDRVVSSLVLHHLTTEDKQRALREVVRVLRPGGELHVVDFGKPHTLLGRLFAPLIQRLEEAEANIKGQLPEMFRQAGFVQVEETDQFATVLGTLAMYQACRPE